MFRTLSLVVFTICAAPVLAGNLTITEITVDPSPALPGEPIWVTISIRNDGSSTVPVPLGGLLEATPEGGEPKALRTYLGSVLSPLHEAGYQQFNPTVGPGETLRLDFTNGRIADGWLLETPELWQPGRHRLRVVLFDGDWTVTNGRSAAGHIAWTDLHGGGHLTKPPIASPAAIFHVRKPSGDDAAAWQEFIRRTNGRGWVNQKPEDDAEIAYDIATKFPDSAYAPYFAIAASYKFRLAVDHEARRRFLNEVAKRHPENAAIAEYAQL
jgi:hypothetical protein